MQQSVDKETIIQICRYGKYYNPAEAHYNNGQSIVCDRCFKRNLHVCIGYDKYDLCLTCVEEITNCKQQCPCPPPHTEITAKMRQSQFNKC